MKWRIDKNSKIKPLNFGPIPEYVTGRLRKDGKPDRRYTTGMYMLQEYLDEIFGVSPQTRRAK